MKFFKTSTLKKVFTSLMLSLVLAGSALATDKVNINTANATELDRVLLNVGPTKAEAIVAYRKQNGAFRSPEQLAMVKGIGLKTVEKNRDRILIGASSAAPRTAAASRTTATPARPSARAAMQR
nr:ComEA family DNA-binding protein [Luteimonas panaciterrae]